MRDINVVAAILHKNNSYFCAKRGYGEFKGLWEFPGGKIEIGESDEQALKREIREELNIDIIVEAYFTTVHYQYPTFSLTMHCYLCAILKGQIEFREHITGLWLNAIELGRIKWLPADQEVVRKLIELYAQKIDQ